MPSERPLPANGRDVNAAQDLETAVSNRKSAVKPEPVSRAASEARVFRRSVVGAIAGDRPCNHVSFPIPCARMYLRC